MTFSPSVLTYNVKFLTNFSAGISTNSRRNIWGKPPSKASTHSILIDSIEWLDTVQFCRENGRPICERKIVIKLFERRIFAKNSYQLQQFERCKEIFAHQSHFCPNNLSFHSLSRMREYNSVVTFPFHWNAIAMAAQFVHQTSWMSSEMFPPAVKHPLHILTVMFRVLKLPIVPLYHLNKQEQLEWQYKNTKSK